MATKFLVLLSKQKVITMEIKRFDKKLLFYSGLLIFVAILEINYLVGLLGGVLYIFMWHFIFEKGEKENKDLPKLELSESSPHIEPKEVEQFSKVKIMKHSNPKQFVFWKVFMNIFLFLLTILIIFYGFIGAFKGNFGEVFWKVLILLGLLTSILTFLLKWNREWKEKSNHYKDKNNLKDQKINTIPEKEKKGGMLLLRLTNFTKKPIIILILVLVSAFVLVGCFFIDVGINSKFFIERDFNQAFKYRLTGDCDSFVDYINKDKENWKERCKKERKNENPPIENFQIKNISHKFGSNRAFLQVEITRNIFGKDHTYSVNYEMRKIGISWKIDQKLR